MSKISQVATLTASVFILLSLTSFRPIQTGGNLAKSVINVALLMIELRFTWPYNEIRIHVG